MEQQRFETKHLRQLEESRATANSAVKEKREREKRVNCSAPPAVSKE